MKPLVKPFGHTLYILLFRLMLAGAFAAVATSASSQTVEGKDYELINPPRVAASNTIEVVEFFSYGCPYCGQMEPGMQEWLKKKPADVTFKRTSIARGERWIGYAHAFYALEMLGQESRLTPSIFNAVHKDKTDLNEASAFFDWAAKQGVDRAKLEAAYRSDAVAQKMKEAEQARVDYKVRKIPTVYVDGRYHVFPEGIPPDGVSGYSRTPAVLDELIQKARDARKAVK